MIISPILWNIVLPVLVNATTQETKIKSISTWKVEDKITLFLDNINILCLKKEEKRKQTKQITRKMTRKLLSIFRN